MIIADDPQGLAAEGEPVADWIDNAVGEMLDQGWHDGQTQPELYDRSVYYKVIGRE
jgi:hypothetical protein